MPATTPARALVTGPGEPDYSPGTPEQAGMAESPDAPEDLPDLQDLLGLPDTGGRGPASGLLADLGPGQRARLTVWLRGRVQGVGFRWWVRKNALDLGLLGVAENLTDGRVKVIAEGERDSLVELLGRLGGPGTPGQVAQVTHRWDQVRGDFIGFAER